MAATSPKMAPRLSAIPEELISNIACRLGADDKFALRLTCRTLEDRSFHEFATEFFSLKCVHLTTDSLKPLVEISGSRLAKYVKEVDFIPALFSEQGFKCPGTNTAHWKPSVRQSEAYKFYMQDQVTLRTTGEDKKMLTGAFSSLPSLKTVAFVDCEALLTPDTDYRGGNKVLRKTGTGAINGSHSFTRLTSEDFRKHLEHLWSTVIGALANAQAHSSLGELRTKCSTDMTYLNPRQFKFDASVLAKLRGVVFGNLTRLHLHLMSQAEGKGNKGLLANFATCFPSVKELFLDFDSHPGSGTVFKRFTAPLDFSQITIVNIIGLSIEAKDLVTAVTRMSNVTVLKLYCVDITTGTWPPVLKAMEKLEKLEHLHLMYLREAGCKSYFLKQRDPRDDPEFMNSVFGDEWDDEEDMDDVDDEDDGETDDTDEDLPDLQPADEAADAIASMVEETQAGAEAGPAPAFPISDPVDQPHVDDDAVSEYVPPGMSGASERGFYVCLEGHDKIAKRLKTFIDEYNVGEYMGADGGFDMGGVGPVPGVGGMAIPIAVGVGAGPPAPPPPGADFGAFMNAMGNALGFQPPPPMPGQNANPPPNAATTPPGNPPANNPLGIANGSANTTQATAGAGNSSDLDWESEDDDDGVPLMDDVIE